MRIFGYASLSMSLSVILPAHAQNAAEDGFSFKTTEQFASECGGASPPEECLNAIMHVEQVVDHDGNFHPVNSTCDGGPEALLKSQTNAELTEKLTERLVRVVEWLKMHPEYGPILRRWRVGSPERRLLPLRRQSRQSRFRLAHDFPRR